MSPVLLRYLAREIFAASALVLVAFLGLFAFFDFINELEDVGKGGYTLYQALVYVALTLPARVYELMPIAVLIGTLVCARDAGEELRDHRDAGLGHVERGC